MNSRTIRVSAAALLIGATAATLWPHVTSYVSSSAVVNAPVVRIKAPFNGVVAEVSAGRAGAEIGRDRPLLSLDRARATTGEVAAIAAEAQVVAAGIASLGAQIAAIEAVAADLAIRIDAHRDEAGTWIAAKGRVVAADTRRAEAKLDLARRALDRIARLAARGAAPEAELESVRAALAVARAERDRLGGEAARLAIEGEAIARGIMLDSSAEGAGYARQRLDEVAILLADLRARRGVLEARREALAGTREEAAARLAEQHSFAPVSAVDGVVWRAAPEAGSEVAVGDVLLEIVDCRRRFLEVSLPERHIERVRPGDAALVHLKGSAGTITATVSAVGGSSARLSDETFASARPERMEGAAQILLTLPPAMAGDDDAFGFCDVGRTAEVRFARQGVPALGQPLAAVLDDMRERFL